MTRDPRFIIRGPRVGPPRPAAAERSRMSDALDRARERPPRQRRPRVSRVSAAPRIFFDAENEP